MLLHHLERGVGGDGLIADGHGSLRGPPIPGDALLDLEIAAGGGNIAAGPGEDRPVQGKLPIVAAGAGELAFHIGRQVKVLRQIQRLAVPGALAVRRGVVIDQRHRTALGKADAVLRHGEGQHVQIIGFGVVGRGQLVARAVLLQRLVLVFNDLRIAGIGQRQGDQRVALRHAHVDIDLLVRVYLRAGAEGLARLGGAGREGHIAVHGLQAQGVGAVAAALFAIPFDALDLIGHGQVRIAGKFHRGRPVFSRIVQIQRGVIGIDGVLRQIVRQTLQRDGGPGGVERVVVPVHGRPVHAAHDGEVGGAHQPVVAQLLGPHRAHGIRARRGGLLVAPEGVVARVRALRRVGDGRGLFCVRVGNGHRLGGRFALGPAFHGHGAVAHHEHRHGEVIGLEAVVAAHGGDAGHLIDARPGLRKVVALRVQQFKAGDAAADAAIIVAADEAAELHAALAQGVPGAGSAFGGKADLAGNRHFFGQNGIVDVCVGARGERVILRALARGHEGIRGFRPGVSHRSGLAILSPRHADFLFQLGAQFHIGGDAHADRVQQIRTVLVNKVSTGHLHPRNMDIFKRVVAVVNRLKRKTGRVQGQLLDRRVEDGLGVRGIFAFRKGVEVGVLSFQFDVHDDGSLFPRRYLCEFLRRTDKAKAFHAERILPYIVEGEICVDGRR